MPNLTVIKTITYTDADSGASFSITSTKVKKATHAYRQVMTAADGVQRNIFEVGTDPSYTKLHCATFRNVGNFDAYIVINSGGEASWNVLPPGRTFEVWNLNYWNQDSATNPDTIDTIEIQGDGGTCKVKIDAYLS